MNTRTAAARSARALLDVVIRDANPEQVEQELVAFAGLFQSDPQLQRALTNPAVPTSAKRGIVENLAKRLNVTPHVAKLLLLLAERDRLGMLPDLVAVYRDRLMEYRKVMRAEVITAAPLAPDRVAQLEKRLGELTGRRVTMTAKVDPALIGGAVARVGSTVYDGSIATQLSRIRERLEER
jgi:F-type H+-transporting ATPase subunit delta